MMYISSDGETLVNFDKVSICYIDDWNAVMVVANGHEYHVEPSFPTTSAATEFLAKIAQAEADGIKVFKAERKIAEMER